MRKIIFTILAVLPLASTAQTKILETSAKKAPAWLVSTGSDHFVSTNVAPTIEEAKQLCIDDVKKQIISAVAENIKSSTAGSTSQTTQGQEIVEFLDKFDSKYETRSAVLPFVNGVSMSKVEDFFYQKLQDKNTGKITVTYSILYPFSSTELKSLISKFRKQDAEMEAKLNEQIALIGNIKTTEQIDRGISAMAPLIDYFFDDVRLNKAKQTLSQLQKLYSYVTIVLEQSTRGSLQYSLLLDGNKITSSTKPTIKSNCATEIMHRTDADGIVTVTYDPDGCLHSEDNYIDISYRFTGGSSKAKFYPVMASEPLKVAVTGQLVIKLGEKIDSVTYKGLEVQFQLNNQSTSNVTLQALNFSIQELRNTVNIDAQQISIEPGVRQITVKSEDTFHLNHNAETEFKLPIAKGNITVRNSKDGSIGNVSIASKYSF